MSERTVYVVMVGGRPMGVAGTVDAAKECAEADARRYCGPEFRWNDHPDGLRLMSRDAGRRRFAWTHIWVATVPQVGGAR